MVARGVKVRLAEWASAMWHGFLDFARDRFRHALTHHAARSRLIIERRSRLRYICPKFSNNPGTHAAPPLHGKLLMGENFFVRGGAWTES